MAWMHKNKHIVLTLLMLLLSVSFLGPWSYDLINVPAEYTCALPNIRLYGDFCGMPISWFSGVALFARDFFYSLQELVTGTFSGELLGMVLLILPTLPVLSTLLLLRKKDTSRLRIVHLVAWGLGCLIPLFILLLQPNIQISRLWGPGLYIGVAISAASLELLLWKRRATGNSDVV